MPLLYKGGDFDMFPCQQGCYNKINSGKKATVFQIEMLCANWLRLKARLFKSFQSDFKKHENRKNEVKKVFRTSINLTRIKSP